MTKGTLARSLFVRRLLQCTAALCVLGIFLLLVPLMQGSLEEFPTDEQHAKVRISVGLVIFLLAIVAGISFTVLKRLKRQPPPTAPHVHTPR